MAEKTLQELESELAKATAAREAAENERKKALEEGKSLLSNPDTISAITQGLQTKSAVDTALANPTSENVTNAVKALSGTADKALKIAKEAALDGTEGAGIPQTAAERDAEMAADLGQASESGKAALKTVTKKIASSYSWAGADDQGSFINNVFNTAGGVAGAGVDLFKKMKNGDIEDGREWLAWGGGAALALWITNMAKGYFTWIDKIPGGGLLIFVALLGVIGGMIHKNALPYTGQGTGNAATNTVKNNPENTTQGHAGGVARKVQMAVDPENQKPWELIEAVDDDGDGPNKFAVQIHNDDGKTIADLRVLAPKEISDALLAPKTFHIPAAFMLGNNLTADDFEYGACDINGEHIVVLQPKTGGAAGTTIALHFSH